MLDPVSGFMQLVVSLRSSFCCWDAHFHYDCMCECVFVGHHTPWLTKHIHSQMSWEMVLLSVKNDTRLTNLRLRAVERQSFTIHIAHRLLEVQWWFIRVCRYNSHNTHQTPLPDREKEIWNLIILTFATLTICGGHFSSSQCSAHSNESTAWLLKCQCCMTIIAANNHTKEWIILRAKQINI